MRKISAYAELKEKLIKIVEDTFQVTQHFESINEIKLPTSDSVQNLLDALQTPEFVIAVVGVIKRGKSTFINAFLEAACEIVSTNVTPETARLSYLLYGDEPYAIIHNIDGSTKRIAIQNLPQYTSAYKSGFIRRSRGDRISVEQTAYAEIHFPNKYLRGGVILVDTPGVDDPDVKRSLITENFVAKADAVIFMVDVLEGGLKESELRFLKSRLINKKSSKGIICVCNKIMALRKHQKQELPKLIQSTKEKLANELNIQIPVYPIDALAAFEGFQGNDQEKYQNSGFSEFLSAFEEKLIDIKGGVMLRKRLVEFRSILEANLSQIQFQHKATADNLSQLKTDLLMAEKKLKEQESFFHDFLKRIHKERERFLLWVEQEVRREFSEIVVSEKLGLDHVYSQVARALQGLNNIVTQRLNQTLCGYLGEINAEEIIIPELTLQTENLDLSFEKYQSSRIIKEKSAIDWSNALTSAGISAGVGAIIPGIGFVMGGLIGLLIPVFEREFVEREEIHLDTAGLRKELSSLIERLSDSFAFNSASAFEEFDRAIEQWFKQRRHELKSSEQMLIAASERSFEEWNERKSSLEKIMEKLGYASNSIREISEEIEVLS